VPPQIPTAASIWGTDEVRNSSCDHSLENKCRLTCVDTCTIELSVGGGFLLLLDLASQMIEGEFSPSAHIGFARGRPLWTDHTILLFC
jgi:hypothetical protein